MDAWDDAVEDEARRDPRIADELRERLRMIRALEAFTPSAALGVDEPTWVPARIDSFTRLERIGSGGMGVVFRAHDERLGRDVALKLIRPERLLFEGALLRFQREVETVAQLTHPNIVAVHSVGAYAGADERANLPYFAMELLEGRSLSEVLRALCGCAPEALTGADLLAALGGGQSAAGEPGEGGGPPRRTAPAALFEGSWVDAVLRVGVQLAGALEHAHSRGVVHRDVKPSNVMLAPSGRVVLFDFGLTATHAASLQRLTATGNPVGTLVYMAPEQLEGRETSDARADVYSLGVTLYELLALQAPFGGESSLAIQRAVLMGDADRLRGRNRRVTADVEVVVAKAMAKSAADRYPSATALREDLENLLARRPVRAKAPSAWIVVARWVQRRPAAALASASLALLLVGGPLVFLWLERRHSTALEALVDKERAAKGEALAANAELEDVVNFTLGMFRRATPGRNGGVVPDARQMLQLGAQELPALAGRPDSKARIQLVLGELFGLLTEVGSAQPHFDAALEYYAARDDEDARAQRMFGLRRSAHNLMLLRRFEEAEAQLAEALQLARETYGDDALELHVYYATEADLQRDAGRLEASFAARARSLAVLERAGVPEDDVRVARARGMLGVNLESLGRPSEARVALENALAWNGAHDGALGAEESLFLLTLADLDLADGESARALERARRAHERLLASHGSDNFMTEQAELTIADVLGRTGRFGEASPMLAGLAASIGARLPAAHPLVVRVRRLQLGCLVGAGRHVDAVSLCQSTGLVAACVEAHGLADSRTRQVLHTLAVSAQIVQDYECAAAVLQRLVDAEFAAEPWGARHADAILMLAAMRLKTDQTEQLSASEAQLRDLVAGIGAAPLPVVSSANGQTYEGGYMALVFLAQVAGRDPARLAVARDLERRAEVRKQVVMEPQPSAARPQSDGAAEPRTEGRMARRR